MLKNKKYQVAIGYFDFISREIKECFTPIYKNKSKRMVAKIKFRRIVFIEKSKLLRMWCDCTANIEYDKIRDKILKYNKLNKSEINLLPKKWRRYFST